jgi:hypothetical protein
VFNSILQHNVSMPTAEDVIVQKLRWGRPQDRIDAENVMDVQFPQLDWSYIELWCGQHDRLALLQEIRSGLEPLA